MNTDNENLKGNVKSFTETERRIPLILNSSIVSTTYHFNKKGKLTDENTVQQRRRTTSSFSRDLIKYNEDGNIIEQSNGEESDRFYHKIVYKYNKFKQRESITEYNISGEIVSERRFKYLNDYSNKIDTMTTVNEYGENILDFKNRIDYPSSSETKNKLTPKSDDVIREEFEYDKVGNWTKKTVFENDKKILVYDRTYIYHPTLK